MDNLYRLIGVERGSGYRAIWLLSLTIASSASMAVSFPPLGLAPLAWVGLSPFLFALRQSSPLTGAGLGFLFGSLFCVGTFHWFAQIMSPVNFLLCLLVFSSYYLAFGFLYRMIAHRVGPWTIIAGPALWGVCEYVRSNLSFLSFPWNLLGHSQHGYLIFIQIANITGVYGVSFLIIMINQLLSQMPDLLSNQKNRLNGRTCNPSRFAWVAQSLAVILLLAAASLYGWKEINTPEGGQQLRIAIVQPNLVARDDMPSREQATHLHTYEQLSREAAQKKPDLIVWPASSLPAPVSSFLVRFYMMRLSIQTKGYLLVGGSGREKDRSKKEGDLPYSNSEFLISPSGKLVGQYNKIRLLPFNEYLPLKGLINWPEWITPMKEGFIPGDKYTVFQVPGAKFGAPICWENMFPDLFRQFVRDGAQFMVSATNEAFLGRTAALHQSLAINIFRAVENRVAIVRAATTGVSCFINPDGRVVERITDGNGKDLFVSGILVRDVPLASKKTFYTIHGDVFAYLIMGISGFSILTVMFRKKQT